jgi:hypothetical protein
MSDTEADRGDFGDDESTESDVPIKTEPIEISDSDDEQKYAPPPVRAIESDSDVQELNPQTNEFAGRKRVQQQESKSNTINLLDALEDSDEQSRASERESDSEVLHPEIKIIESALEKYFKERKAKLPVAYAAPDVSTIDAFADASKAAKARSRRASAKSKDIKPMTQKQFSSQDRVNRAREFASRLRSGVRELYPTIDRVQTPEYTQQLQTRIAQAEQAYFASELDSEDRNAKYVVFTELQHQERDFLESKVNVGIFVWYMFLQGYKLIEDDTLELGNELDLIDAQPDGATADNEERLRLMFTPLNDALAQVLRADVLNENKEDSRVREAALKTMYVDDSAVRRKTLDTLDARAFATDAQRKIARYDALEKRFTLHLKLWDASDALYRCIDTLRELRSQCEMLLPKSRLALADNTSRHIRQIQNSVQSFIDSHDLFAACMPRVERYMQRAQVYDNDKTQVVLLERAMIELATRVTESKFITYLDQFIEGRLHKVAELEDRVQRSPKRMLKRFLGHDQMLFDSMGASAYLNALLEPYSKFQSAQSAENASLASQGFDWPFESCKTSHQLQSALDAVAAPDSSASSSSSSAETWLDVRAASVRRKIDRVRPVADSVRRVQDVIASGYLEYEGLPQLAFKTLLSTASLLGQVDSDNTLLQDKKQRQVADLYSCQFAVFELECLFAALPMRQAYTEHRWMQFWRACDVDAFERALNQMQNAQVDQTLWQALLRAFKAYDATYAYQFTGSRGTGAACVRQVQSLNTDVNAMNGPTSELAQLWTIDPAQIKTSLSLIDTLKTNLNSDDVRSFVAREANLKNLALAEERVAEAQLGVANMHAYTNEQKKATSEQDELEELTTSMEQLSDAYRESCTPVMVGIVKKLLDASKPDRHAKNIAVIRGALENNIDKDNSEQDIALLKLVLNQDRSTKQAWLFLAKTFFINSSFQIASLQVLRNEIQAVDEELVAFAIANAFDLAQQLRAMNDNAQLSLHDAIAEFDFQQCDTETVGAFAGNDQVQVKAEANSALDTKLADTPAARMAQIESLKRLYNASVARVNREYPKLLSLLRNYDKFAVRLGDARMKPEAFAREKNMIETRYELLHEMDSPFADFALQSRMVQNYPEDPTDEARKELDIEFELMRDKTAAAKGIDEEMQKSTYKLQTDGVAAYALVVESDDDDSSSDDDDDEDDGNEQAENVDEAEPDNEEVAIDNEYDLNSGMGGNQDTGVERVANDESTKGISRDEVRKNRSLLNKAVRRQIKKKSELEQLAIRVEADLKLAGPPFSLYELRAAAGNRFFTAARIEDELVREKFDAIDAELDGDFEERSESDTDASRGRTPSDLEDNASVAPQEEDDDEIEDKPTRRTTRNAIKSGAVQNDIIDLEVAEALIEAVKHRFKSQKADEGDSETEEDSEIEITHYVEAPNRTVFTRVKPEPTGDTKADREALAEIEQQEKDAFEAAVDAYAKQVSRVKTQALRKKKLARALLEDDESSQDEQAANALKASTSKPEDDSDPEPATTAKDVPKSRKSEKPLSVAQTARIQQIADNLRQRTLDRYSELNMQTAFGIELDEDEILNAELVQQLQSTSDPEQINRLSTELLDLARKSITNWADKRKQKWDKILKSKDASVMDIDTWNALVVTEISGRFTATIQMLENKFKTFIANGFAATQNAAKNTQMLEQQDSNNNAAIPRIKPVAPDSRRPSASNAAKAVRRRSSNSEISESGAKRQRTINAKASNATSSGASQKSTTASKRAPKTSKRQRIPSNPNAVAQAQAQSNATSDATQEQNVQRRNGVKLEQNAPRNQTTDMVDVTEIGSQYSRMRDDDPNKARRQNAGFKMPWAATTNSDTQSASESDSDSATESGSESESEPSSLLSRFNARHALQAAAVAGTLWWLKQAYTKAHRHKRPALIGAKSSTVQALYDKFALPEHKARFAEQVSEAWALGVAAWHARGLIHRALSQGWYQKLHSLLLEPSDSGNSQSRSQTSSHLEWKLQEWFRKLGTETRDDQSSHAWPNLATLRHATPRQMQDTYNCEMAKPKSSSMLTAVIDTACAMWALTVHPSVVKRCLMGNVYPEMCHMHLQSLKTCECEPSCSERECEPCRKLCQCICNYMWPSKTKRVSSASREAASDQSDSESENSDSDARDRRMPTTQSRKALQRPLLGDPMSAECTANNCDLDALDARATQLKIDNAKQDAESLRVLLMSLNQDLRDEHDLDTDADELEKYSIAGRYAEYLAQLQQHQLERNSEPQGVDIGIDPVIADDKLDVGTRTELSRVAGFLSLFGARDSDSGSRSGSGSGSGSESDSEKDAGSRFAVRTSPTEQAQKTFEKRYDFDALDQNAVYHFVFDKCDSNVEQLKFCAALVVMFGWTRDGWNSQSIAHCARIMLAALVHKLYHVVLMHSSDRELCIDIVMREIRAIRVSELDLWSMRASRVQQLYNQLANDASQRAEMLQQLYAQYAFASNLAHIELKHELAEALDSNRYELEFTKTLRYLPVRKALRSTRERALQKIALPLVDTVLQRLMTARSSPFQAPTGSDMRSRSRVARLHHQVAGAMRDRASHSDRDIQSITRDLRKLDPQDADSVADWYIGMQRMHPQDVNVLILHLCNALVNPRSSRSGKIKLMHRLDRELWRAYQQKPSYVSAAYFKILQSLREASQRQQSLDLKSKTGEKMSVFDPIEIDGVQWVPIESVRTSSADSGTARETSRSSNPTQGRMQKQQSQQDAADEREMLEFVTTHMRNARTQSLGVERQLQQLRIAH